MNKKLNLLDSIMLIMGSMIGSGIFIVSAGMLRELGSPTMLILAWLVTAALTLMAALSYGELAALMPKAGGQYVYLKEAYSPLFGFLYGWTLFTIIQTGTIAAVAVGFAKFTGVIFPVFSEKNILFSFQFSSNFTLNISAAQLLGIGLIALLTVFNFGKVKNAALLQNFFTIGKIGSLLFIIFAGLYFILSNQNPTNLSNQLTESTTSSIPNIGIFAAALVGSIFSADAWNNITFTAGEMENPKRNLPLSLLIGTGSVLFLYVLINFIYINALAISEIQNADQDRVGTLLLQKIFGTNGAIIMAALIMISTFGCVNGIILSGSRVYKVMADEGLFFKQAAQLNKHQSPQKSLTYQAIWASILVLSGSYGDLLDYVVFAVLIFYILTVGAVFILRKKQPNADRPYKVIAYPFLPVLYIVMALIICICLLIFKTAFAFTGLCLVLLGVPIYYLVKPKNA
ncbi:MAG: amino acid permease [Bacteroidia bacterium]|nr:amino acid permease [Bacteroidia bacterium]